jgi:hypothetical protein
VASKISRICSSTFHCARICATSRIDNSECPPSSKKFAVALMLFGSSLRRRAQSWASAISVWWPGRRTCRPREYRLARAAPCGLPSHWWSAATRQG